MRSSLQTLIRDLDDTISALEPHQVLVFYEAVGCMVYAEKDAKRQQELLAATMRSSNEQWKSRLQQPNAAERLQSDEAMVWIVNFLRKNAAICKSLKVRYVHCWAHSQIRQNRIDCANVAMDCVNPSLFPFPVRLALCIKLALFMKICSRSVERMTIIGHCSILWCLKNYLERLCLLSSFS